MIKIQTANLLENNMKNTVINHNKKHKTKRKTKNPGRGNKIGKVGVEGTHNIK